jgi:hypothetical protein
MKIGVWEERSKVMRQAAVPSAARRGTCMQIVYAS